MDNKRVRIFNIQYDTDNQAVDLPSELRFRFTYKDHEELEDLICEAISDETGFCHVGFCYDIL